MQQQQDHQQQQQQQRRRIHLNPLMMNQLPCYFAPAPAGFQYIPAALQQHYNVIRVPTAALFHQYGMAPNAPLPQAFITPAPTMMQVPPLHFAPPPSQPAAAPSGSSPIHLIENSQQLRLSMDLPGMQSKHVRISMGEDPVTKEGVLSVRALRKIFSLDGKTCVKKIQMCKQFGMDLETVDISALKAKLQNGVLIVTAPKRQAGANKQEQQPLTTPREFGVEAPTRASAPVATPEEQRSLSDILPFEVPSAATILPVATAANRGRRTHKRVVSDYEETVSAMDQASTKRQRR